MTYLQPKPAHTFIKVLFKGQSVINVAMNTANSMATIANGKNSLQADQSSVEVHHGQMDLLSQSSQTLPNGTQVCHASSSSWFAWWYAIFPRGLTEKQVSAHTLKYTYHQKASFNGEESLQVDSNSQRAPLSNISSVSMAFDCPPGYVGNWNDGSIIESVDKLLQTGESECFLCKGPYAHLDALR